jgi:hypothetical protein
VLLMTIVDLDLNFAFRHVLRASACIVSLFYRLLVI